MNGKGDRFRPVDRTRYGENYDLAMQKCSIHKDKLDQNCAVCVRLIKETNKELCDEDRSMGD